jgi:hypothetical protein
MKLEELLIDFQELIGAHSGDNMAKVVWETLEPYGLKGRVCYSGIAYPLLTMAYRLLP